MMKQLFFLLLFIVSCSKFESQENAVDLPQSKVSEIRSFIRGKNYNQDLAVFINFKIHSGKYRYFVYDLKNDKILQKAIVSHGSGSVIQNSKGLRFSNVEGSYQSSLGKYEIKESYIGKFGKSYRLNGLESTNNNALQRAIVLHSYSCIPDIESQNPACLSLGCPMLSANAFNQTAKYIDQSKQPIILYAFY
ncbi:murein L,D-transpeptidase catalytic domain family protein [Chryseobacterium daecheongense]|uniref:murein L,D-transpeptidase catalytic domain-containing protein n=1 Tax=Chryseobacterium daecheongense TaxID=192389 RepID=UPI001FD70E93|nr:murein L,D-transpeptidase catalytic domain family protein [Chryseobacterium daecheongense]UOU97674.1 murein L,D-transpeptidase catalytic domain family protein [Chryseobacterium daecheongense]